MQCFRRISSFCAIAMLGIASGLRAKRATNVDVEAEMYTFDKFIEDFDRTYVVGSAEYMRRSPVFEASLAQIFARNARDNPLWTAGVHPFMDWTGDERQRLHGYKPSGMRKQSMAALQSNATLYGASGDSFQAPTPPVINQGDLCGSCWAVSAVEAVEAQLMKSDSPWRKQQYGSPMTLSTQAVLECAPNPHHCGGPGGCKGATGEVAFDYIRNKGIPLESDLGYHPARAGKCPLEPYPSTWARVTISGWKALPSNQAQPLMQALVEDGPVVLAADSHNWYDYLSGIFDSCPKDAVVNHAVLGKGYGEEKGKKYWLIQNSWGERWGEHGNIRVLRHDDDDHYCGTDHHPEEGFACDGSTQPVTVCGTCGILFDPIIPENPQVEAPQQSSLATEADQQAPVSWEMPSLSTAATETATPTDAAAVPDPPTVPSATVPETSKMQQVLEQHKAIAQPWEAPQADISPSLQAADVSNYQAADYQPEIPAIEDQSSETTSRFKISPSSRATDVSDYQHASVSWEMPSLNTVAAETTTPTAAAAVPDPPTVVPSATVPETSKMRQVLQKDKAIARAWDAPQADILPSLQAADVSDYQAAQDQPEIPAIKDQTSKKTSSFEITEDSNHATAAGRQDEPSAHAHTGMLPSSLPSTFDAGAAEVELPNFELPGVDDFQPPLIAEESPPATANVPEADGDEMASLMPKPETFSESVSQYEGRAHL